MTIEVSDKQIWINKIDATLATIEAERKAKWEEYEVANAKEEARTYWDKFFNGRTDFRWSRHWAMYHKENQYEALKKLKEVLTADGIGTIIFTEKEIWCIDNL